LNLGAAAYVGCCGAAPMDLVRSIRWCIDIAYALLAELALLEDDFGR
jgi:hypothetical protein